MIENVNEATETTEDDVAEIEGDGQYTIIIEPGDDLSTIEF